MRNRAEALPGLANTVAIEATEATLRDLVAVTPVDTSEAISNWQVGINQRPPAQIPPHTMGRRGSSRAASMAESISLGEAELAAKQPGETIFLSNTAKHIVDLDRGTSAQFAGGFIPRALIVFRAAMQEAAQRLLK